MEDGRERIKNTVSSTYCVTGATGYIGSWLVRSLLLKGYMVHATVRDLVRVRRRETPTSRQHCPWPSRTVCSDISGKASNLLRKWKGENQLKLFKADLQDEGSFDEAVKGCDGVFHVAASMEFNVRPDQLNIESYVQSNVIDPAIKGTLNLLRACTRAKSVKRVVLTSSISTITAKESDGNWIPMVDESCQVLVDHVWKTRASGWVYVLSKLLSEEAAFKFSNENGIDLVSVITTTVAGPSLTFTVPSSIRVLLSPITGDPHLFPILNAVNSRMGSIGLVHVEDICNAHIFLMEHPMAQGRFMCCTQNCHMCELVDLLAQAYPCSNMKRIIAPENGSIPSGISSKKLKDLGFKYKFSILDIIKETVSYCIECGYLPPKEE